MTWTCWLQLLSQGNSASTCQGSFLRCFYFVFYWLEALGQGNSGDTCQGSFLCCSALTIIHTAQRLVEVGCYCSLLKLRDGKSYHTPSSCFMNARVLVTRSRSGLCLRKRHFVPAATPGGACQVAPASRTETLLAWIESSSSFLLTTGVR